MNFTQSYIIDCKCMKARTFRYLISRTGVRLCRVSIVLCISNAENNTHALQRRAKMEHAR